MQLATAALLLLDTGGLRGLEISDENSVRAFGVSERSYRTFFHPRHRFQAREILKYPQLYRAASENKEEPCLKSLVSF